MNCIYNLRVVGHKFQLVMFISLPSILIILYNVYVPIIQWSKAYILYCMFIPFQSNIPLLFIREREEIHGTIVI